MFLDLTPDQVMNIWQTEGVARQEPPRPIDILFEIGGVHDQYSSRLISLLENPDYGIRGQLRNEFPNVNLDVLLINYHQKC